MTDYPELYVLRHGETTWNVEGRMQGAMNSPLTETGHRQAARQGEILNGIDLGGFQMFSSPQGRAFQTAAIALGAKLGESKLQGANTGMIRTDDRLCEIMMGDWTGKTREQRGAADRFYDDPVAALELYEMAPGGEGFARLRQRCIGFLDGLAGPAVLVTHGITSRMIRATVLGKTGVPALVEMGGGQGVVYHLHKGMQKRLI